MKYECRMHKIYVTLCYGRLEGINMQMLNRLVFLFLVGTLIWSPYALSHCPLTLRLWTTTGERFSAPASPSWRSPALSPRFYICRRFAHPHICTVYEHLILYSFNWWYLRRTKIQVLIDSFTWPNRSYKTKEQTVANLAFFFKWMTSGKKKYQLCGGFFSD